VTYEGKTYKTVVIGTQTWMAENLNYNVTGSKCYNNIDNCTKHGRLYDWATAMALPSSCKSNYCSSQINAKHKGICPTGWHIPSDADWNVLMKFVNPSCIDNAYTCAGARTKLKATNGWNNNGNGEDKFGFSALPGGLGAYGTFYSVGNSGTWWSASENFRASAYSPCIYDEDVLRNTDDKDNLFSVRCLQDD